MKDAKELDDALIERLEDKEFVKWMIEKLNNKQLDLLLYSTSMSKKYNSQEKLPTQFLQNKLLIKTIRTKLWKMKIIPPLGFIVDNREKLGKEPTKEDLLELAEEHNVDDRQKALMLFLQNHYEEALDLYDNRHADDEKSPKKEKPKKEKVEQEPSQPKAETLSPKQEKKLQQKIDTLQKEKEDLINQVQQLKKELKEKNTEHQKEINQLTQDLAAEKASSKKLEEELAQLHKKFESEKAVEREQGNAEKEIEKQESVPKEKKKLAIIGNPKNNKVLRDDRFDIDLFELDNIEELIQSIDLYEHKLFLSYVIDEVLYEEKVSQENREKILTITNFKQLKDVMRELVR
ncbi:hypothetical protein MHZ92_11655 [Sporosarcina sp. ACRSL]|uniref:hypothetical protein n=1 Tax=Sporosarcina sp. ACRSL TaxID=2918215 RepID=UPI001EF623CE|nr:hypothetical protein [Sporosarcina sp. ACRSL]MCG7344792.1 hypothetical protein [Sporosarcina sp. ACRSL]